MADNKDGNLKDVWKNTGAGLGRSFRDLGKTIIKTGATAVKKADKWANGDEQKDDQNETSKDKKSED